MKTITCFQTEDGRVFVNKEDAEKHQDTLTFYGWYEDNKCYGNSEGCRIEAVDMLEWLKENKGVVLRVLGAKP